MSFLVQDDEDIILDESSVLEFLADIDVADEENDLSSVVANNPISSRTELNNNNLVVKKKSWRQRRKKEILNLRELVKQLSAELEWRKIIAELNLVVPDSEVQTIERTWIPDLIFQLKAGQTTEGAMVWKRIAETQLSRQVSEKDNVRLRQTFQCCVQQAKSLQRSVRRKLREDAVAVSMNFVKRYQLESKSVGTSSNNEVVVHDIISGMDALYTDVDSFFGQIGMHNLSCPGRRNVMTTTRDNGVVVEFLDCYAVPFDFRDCENTIWILKVTFAGKLGSEYTSQGQNTRLKCMSTCVSGHGEDIGIVIRTAVRRYVEECRTVFISRVLIKLAYKTFSVAAKETTRTIVMSGASSSTGPTTVMYSHCEAIDLENNPVARSIWQMSPNFGRVVKTWKHSITLFNHQVEDTC